ncbi:MAG: hypothetical protein HY033_06005 [Ignavibacteriae bacterium]|nr:hypothetical protein [Ignavibacteriota bacterium]
MEQPIQQNDINRDLGLGSRVAQQSRLRFLNQDGSFNVERRGLPFFRSLNVYHWMLSMSWMKFNALIVAAYFFTNVMFAIGYTSCGPGALNGSTAMTLGERFLEAFFFSVQTLATIGYGRMSPNGLAANILVTIEALFGLLGFALATGLLFARFSRPSAKIIFSRNALIAPYRGMTAFEFRIANERTNELIEVNATVVLTRNEMIDGNIVRKFYPLTLERHQVMFMPLHWVIVHPIDEKSPLYGITKEHFDATDAEILILLTGVDETFSQTVHARSSYKHHEVVWGSKFADIFLKDDEGKLSIDLRKIHDIEVPV